MAWGPSSDIEDALWRAAERMLPRRAISGRVLREAIIARSRRYTSEREQLSEPEPGRGGRDADLAARALFFTPADAAKVGIPLSELDRSGLLPETGRLSVIDIGAGAGAMSLGLLDYLRARGRLQSHLKLHIRAIDRDSKALELGRAALADIAGRWGASLSVQVDSADVSTLSATRGEADLVLAGTVLNELPPEARLPAVQAMLAALRPGGSVIVIEPALRATARELQQLRDQLLAGGMAHVFAPCTRDTAPCPALADERDWCHEDRRSNLSPRTASLAGATGLRVHGLKFAYLTLRRQPAPQVDNVGDAGDGDRVALRVISRPRRQKGKRECFACGTAGRVTLRLLRRHRDDGNRVFDDSERGDVLVVPARLATGGDIVGGDTIERVHLREPGQPLE